MAFLSKYGVARHIYIPIIKAGVVDFAVSADWTPAAGDVKISKDGGVAANVTNLPTAITMGNTAMWDFSLTATEMQAALVMVTVADSATKAVEDQMFVVETYGNASAEHAFDLDTASTAQTGDNYARLGAPAGASIAADIAAVKTDTAAILVDTGTSGVIVATNNDKTGYTLTQAFPTNFSSLAITVGGAVTAGTVSDKTGYSLTQSFPANFSALAITVGGAVTAGTVSDKTGYALSAAQTFNLTGDITGSLSGSVGSVTAAVAVTSNIKQNQALSGFMFLMTDSTGHAPATGLTVSVTRAIDGGVFGAGTLSAVSEVGNGVYSVNFGAGDLNGKNIILRATATGADDAFERIVTQV